MPRIHPKTISFEEKKKLLNELWSMVALLENRDQVENFFKDLLSESEAIMLARRIRIARFLLDGRRYDDIKRNMNAGDGTIASVHQWLHGGNGGYKNVIPKLEKELERRMRSTQKSTNDYMPYTFAWLKKKYPLHFLLFNLIDHYSSKR